MIFNRKIILTFIISLTISYIIVGYLGSNLFVAIHWIEDVTLVQKLREYYIRTFGANISFSLIPALITTLIVYKKNNK